MRILLITAMVFAANGWIMAQNNYGSPQRGFSEKIVIEKQIDYLLYLPDNYHDRKDERFPLLVFLHGAGERGDDLELVKKHGLPKMIDAGDSFPFIVISPQCPENQVWDTELVYQLITRIESAYSVDKRRIYLTGLSMGGYATWELLADHPDIFAAAIPICGGGEAWRAKYMKDVPIWAFHGARDLTVPVERTREMVEALEKVGGKVKYTEYPEAEHDSWTQTYNTPDLYNWLLEHFKMDESQPG